MFNELLARVVVAVPSVIPYLGAGFYKTYEFMLRTIQGLVRGVYNGNVGGDFVDAVANLIRGQILQAFQQAYEDQGYTFTLPGYLQQGAEQMINIQANFDWIYNYYTDIVDARVDGTPLAPLLARATMWANVYLEAYNEALRLMVLENGGNMVWPPVERSSASISTGSNVESLCCTVSAPLPNTTTMSPGRRKAVSTGSVRLRSRWLDNAICQGRGIRNMLSFILVCSSTRKDL